jgi:hypothetical protein
MEAVEHRLNKNQKIHRGEKSEGRVGPVKPIHIDISSHSYYPHMKIAKPHSSNKWL